MRPPNKRPAPASPDAKPPSKAARPNAMQEFSVLLTREFVQPLKDGKADVMLAIEGTDRGAEELRGLFARAHNINLNNYLGGGVGALWGLPLVVATDADQAFYTRRDMDLRRVLMMELEARAEAIIRKLLAAGGGALPESISALDGSVFVTCSLGAAGDHSFLEAGILPVLTQLGVPISSLGGHMGAIRRYIGDSSKARPDACFSSPLSRFDCCYDRRLGTAAVEMLRLQDAALKKRLVTARASSAAASAAAAGARRSAAKPHNAAAAAAATAAAAAETAAHGAAAEVAALVQARQYTREESRALLTGVLEARCEVKAWATPQPLGAHAAAGSGFAVTAVKTEEGCIAPYLLLLDVHEFLRGSEEEQREDANAQDDDADDAGNTTDASIDNLYSSSRSARQESAVLGETQTVVSDDVEPDDSVSQAGGPASPASSVCGASLDERSTVTAAAGADSAQAAGMNEASVTLPPPPPSPPPRTVGPAAAAVAHTQAAGAAAGDQPPSDSQHSAKQQQQQRVREAEEEHCERHRRQRSAVIEAADEDSVADSEDLRDRGAAAPAVTTAWCGIDTGFFSAGRCTVLDASAGLVWASGDRRIKAFVTGHGSSSNSSSRDGDSSSSRQQQPVHSVRHTLDVGGLCTAITMLNGPKGGLLLAGSSEKGLTGKSVLKYWHTDNLPCHPYEHHEEQQQRKRGSWLDTVDMRGLMRVDKRDLAAAETAETSRGVVCDGELCLDQLHRARAAQVPAAQLHSQLSGLYPTPHQWDSTSSSSSSGSTVLLHFEDAFSLWSFNVETSQADARLLGHLGAVNQVSMDPTRPGLVASASNDGTCKLWDLRTGRPTCTLRGADTMPMHGCALFSVAGQPFAFTGGLDEAVKAWDLRSLRGLYELSTGNACVKSLHWMPEVCALVASTENLHIDEDGAGRDYRYSPQDVHKKAGWPQSARHSRSSFEHPWDSGSHGVIFYDFNVVPSFSTAPRSLPSSGCPPQSSAAAALEELGACIDSRGRRMSGSHDGGSSSSGTDGSALALLQALLAGSSTSGSSSGMSGWGSSSNGGGGAGSSSSGAGANPLSLALAAIEQGNKQS